MKSLPLALKQAKNQLGGDSPWLVTLDIDLDGTFYYLVNNNEDITYNGQVYTAVPFDVAPPKESSKGEIPTVTLNVSNVTRTLQYYMELLAGAVGAPVTLRVVNTAHLAEDYSELTMYFEVMATKCTASVVSFTLGAPNPLNTRFPAEQFIAAHCNWKFKGPECAYAGVASSCNRTLKDCQLKSNSVRFGGFPGLQGGIRLI